MRGLQNASCRKGIPYDAESLFWLEVLWYTVAIESYDRELDAQNEVIVGNIVLG